MNGRPLTSLKGVGEKTGKLFERLGIVTLRDLLSYYPRDYQAYERPVPIGQLKEQKVMSVESALVTNADLLRFNRMQLVSARIRDLSGSLQLAWYNMPYMRASLKTGQLYVFRGRVVRKRGGLVMEQPEVFAPEAYAALEDSLQPIYGQTKGLGNKAIVKLMRQALEVRQLEREYMPAQIRRRQELAEINYALERIHFPADRQELLFARKRLVFDEFFLFLTGVKKLKEQRENKASSFVMQKTSLARQLEASLPYALTKAQERALADVRRDMQSGLVMNRLIQGDVGSGKTIVAVLALLSVALEGMQGAIMAPTEVLARQHFANITKLLAEHQIPVKAELLTGSMTAKEKRRAYDRIECGYAKIIVGTHALIQGAVNYDQLALVVTDEQHRFGVRQREAFAKKGGVPHVLVMSATPIPRTLAIILYGDLDISVIDELPANRLPIKNCVVDTGYRATAYHFMKKQISEGRQCYIICPMVEESEHLEVENVLDYSAMLQEEMGSGIVVGCLHGKMKQAEKDEIMEQFARNEIQILVSTTVIEVGIDVANATVMMIENAERFGLAQLHQLRGRVGRGKHQSYCIFMTGLKAKETKERLDILNKSNDGFKIASEDLRLRGPGDLFGIRQSGLMDFRLGDVYQDAKILQKANEAADLLIQENSEWLQKIPEYESTASVII